MKDDQTPIAILVSDIHLSHNPPAARAGEPDWYVAMRRPLLQLKKAKAELNVPILCSGDIFDHWKSPPELINFAIDNLPFMYAIPGQHDLPNHSLVDVQRSAYATLEHAKKIETLDRRGLQLDKDIHVSGFAWGVPVEPPPPRARGVKVAMIHDYLWIDGHGYTGAPQEKNILAHQWRESAHAQTGWWNILSVGDNHSHFAYTVRASTKGHYCLAWNNGGFMRRRSDEQDRKPGYGVLCSDGAILRVPFDLSHEVFVPVTKDEVVERALDRDTLDELRKQLISLEASSLDYAEALQRAMVVTGIAKDVRHIVERVLENGRVK